MFSDALAAQALDAVGKYLVRAVPQNMDASAVAASDIQIAEQLVISRRTADRHVSNILTKLGLATRSQISAWTSERRILSAEVR